MVMQFFWEIVTSPMHRENCMCSQLRTGDATADKIAGKKSQEI